MLWTLSGCSVEGMSSFSRLPWVCKLLEGQKFEVTHNLSPNRLNRPESYSFNKNFIPCSKVMFHKQESWDGQCHSGTVLMCVEFNEGPSLPSCLQLLLFSLSHLLWGLYLCPQCFCPHYWNPPFQFFLCIFDSRTVSLPSWSITSECPPVFFYAWDWHKHSEALSSCPSCPLWVVLTGGILEFSLGIISH